ncbi:MAG: NUDIX hydrolase [Deltaproteobacteria bacterium]|nr:NUDIX hydrolase [Deltaproteobacteria bacterium]
MRSPLVAVDVVIFTIADGELQALLVQLKGGPFAERWAFPGGLVPVGEAPEATATRELLTQTGIHDVYLEQLRSFGDPRRDPNAHVVSIAYFALVSDKGESQGNSKYTRLGWFPVPRLPSLAYDHNAIAAYALERLRSKLEYTNIVYSLLPSEFTLGELQEVYEIILGRWLDRRNFRKKILSLSLLRPLHRQRRGAHRPAQLYRFTRRTPMTIEML